MAAAKERSCEKRELPKSENDREIIALHRLLRRDNVVCHGLAPVPGRPAADQAADTIREVLGVAVTVVESRWMGREDATRRPLWIRLRSETERRSVREAARVKRPKGIYFDNDLCAADQRARAEWTASRRERRPPPPAGAAAAPPAPPPEPLAPADALPAAEQHPPAPAPPVDEPAPAAAPVQASHGTPATDAAPVAMRTRAAARADPTEAAPLRLPRAKEKKRSVRGRHTTAAAQVNYTPEPTRCAPTPVPSQLSPLAAPTELGAVGGSRPTVVGTVPADGGDPPGSDSPPGAGLVAQVEEILRNLAEMSAEMSATAMVTET